MSSTGYEITPQKFRRIFANAQNKSWAVKQASTLEDEENHFVFDPQNRKWRYARKSNIDGSLTLGREKWKSVKDVITISSEFREQYEKAKERIIKLCQNQDDASSPNYIARESALETLDLLRNHRILPSLINSTGDESLIFEFFVENNFYLIEFHNSGELIYLRRIVGQPKFVTETNNTQLKEVIKEIARAYHNVNV